MARLVFILFIDVISSFRMSKMNNANFLAVPLKTTSEVDLVKPLTTYIDTVYNTSDDNKPEISEAIQVCESSLSITEPHSRNFTNFARKQ